MLTGTIEGCGGCRWMDEETGVCVNADSENVADFVSESDWCEKWEEKEDNG